MITTLRKRKAVEKNGGMSKADRLAMKLGGKRFDVDEPFDSPFDSDEELDDFLRWREDIRTADVEAQKIGGHSP